MLCASKREGPLLDHCTSVQDLGCPSEKHVRWGEIPQRLMITLPIVVLNESRNRLLELPGEIVMLQTDHVFNRAMITLNFALGLGMVGRTVNVLDLI